MAGTVPPYVIVVELAVIVNGALFTTNVLVTVLAWNPPCAAKLAVRL
jgi:hypothetical protein